jgi:peptide/nickel transport system ATP-binding protein
MDAGKVVESGAAERVLAAPAHPITARLVAASG